jgi:biopolymer transport protein ExbD
MTWKIRHQGSPSSIDGLTLAQVIEGMQDGLWELTDEVMGPQDESWVPIETHPQLSETAAELEPPLSISHDDETRLDMNPLIDVALVLLIFFMLTTSYAAVKRVLEMPTGTTRNAEGRLVYTKAKVAEVLIKVEARPGPDGKPVYRVEDEEVDEKFLRPVIAKYVREKRKTELLVDAEGVDWGAVVAIPDAAKGAGVERVLFLNRKK